MAQQPSVEEENLVVGDKLGAVSLPVPKGQDGIAGFGTDAAGAIFNGISGLYKASESIDKLLVPRAAKIINDVGGLVVEFTGVVGDGVTREEVHTVPVKSAFGADGTAAGGFIGAALGTAIAPGAGTFMIGAGGAALGGT